MNKKAPEISEEDKKKYLDACAELQKRPKEPLERYPHPVTPVYPIYPAPCPGCGACPYCGRRNQPHFRPYFGDPTFWVEPQITYTCSNS